MVVKERLYNRVKISDNGCHEWQGCTNMGGYGQIKISNKQVGTHRASWIAHYGSIPEGLSVLHKCDNRICINPDHLFVGTTQDNVTDKVNKKRHCFGEMNGRAKLDSVSVMIINEAYTAGFTQPQIASYFKVNRRTIGRALLKQNWSHL